MMPLPAELMLDLIVVIANGLPLNEVFRMRRVNTLFAEELLKKIMRNGRLEREGFHVHDDRRDGCERQAWGRCPRELQVRYLYHKLQEHKAKPTEFSDCITQILEIDEVKNASPEERQLILEKLLHGVTAIPFIDCYKFITGHKRAVLADRSDAQPIEESYQVLVACNAVQRRDNAEFSRLVEGGLDVTVTCLRFYLRPIYVAASNGTASMAVALAKRLNLLRDGSSDRLTTIFHLSVNRGNQAAVHVWLRFMQRSRTVDVAASMETAITGSAEVGNLNMVKFLLGRCREHEFYIRYRALIPAIESEFVKIVNFLVTYPGFDPKVVDIYCDDHPLRVARRCRNRQRRREIIVLLIKSGLDLDVKIRPLGDVEGPGTGITAEIVSDEEDDDDDEDNEEDEDDGDEEEEEGDEEEDDDDESDLEEDKKPNYLVVRMSQLIF